MIRYVTRRPRAGLDPDTGSFWQEGESLTVFEPSPEPQETGLLDAFGNRLYRVEEFGPIGFQCKPRVRVKAARGKKS